MYEITMRIQDVNSADYECPFEAKFVDEDVAKAAFDAILDRREFWEEFICKRYGLTEKDEPWIQLFLADEDSNYHDEDEYWMSYEVL